MADQLYEHYSEVIRTEDLSWMAKDIEFVRIDTITDKGKDWASFGGPFLIQKIRSRHSPKRVI